MGIILVCEAYGHPATLEAGAPGQHPPWVVEGLSQPMHAEGWGPEPADWNNKHPAILGRGPNDTPSSSHGILHQSIPREIDPETPPLLAWEDLCTSTLSGGQSLRTLPQALSL